MDLEAEIGALRRQLAAQQAQIDWLMSRASPGAHEMDPQPSYAAHESLCVQRSDTGFRVERTEAGGTAYTCFGACPGAGEVMCLRLVLDAKAPPRVTYFGLSPRESADFDP